MGLDGESDWCWRLHSDISSFTFLLGLDPAGGDLYEDIADRSVFLNNDDADFVDTIHTNSYGNGATYEAAVADVDFYPHNGGRQPPCPDPGNSGNNPIVRTHCM